MFSICYVNTNPESHLIHCFMTLCMKQHLCIFTLYKDQYHHLPFIQTISPVFWKSLQFVNVNLCTINKQSFFLHLFIHKYFMVKIMKLADKNITCSGHTSHTVHHQSGRVNSDTSQWHISTRRQLQAQTPLGGAAMVTWLLQLWFIFFFR